MTDLKHAHLLTMQLTVDYAAIKVIGPTPAGLRRIAPVTGGTFSGARLSGTVHGGADWVINRADAVMVIDVRLTLETGDGALIYLAYQGRFLAEPEVMARFAKGARAKLMFGVGATLCLLLAVANLFGGSPLSALIPAAAGGSAIRAWRVARATASRSLS